MQKRTFDILRKKILSTLKGGQKTVNQIATESGINWKTVDRHLVHLIGKGFVKTVFESAYVKIYELSEKGEDEVKTAT